MEEKILEYSPILIVLMMFFIQHRIFGTPEQLERKHREIIESVEQRFVSTNSFNDLKGQFTDMKEKIDKIYDCLISYK